MSYPPIVREVVLWELRGVMGWRSLASAENVHGAGW